MSPPSPLKPSCAVLLIPCAAYLVYYEVTWELTEWKEVPAEAILQVSNPTGSPVICHSTKNEIWCFVPDIAPRPALGAAAWRTNAFVVLAGHFLALLCYGCHRDGCLHNTFVSRAHC